MLFERTLWVLFLACLFRKVPSPLKYSVSKYGGTSAGGPRYVTALKTPDVSVVTALLLVSIGESGVSQKKIPQMRRNGKPGVTEELTFVLLNNVLSVTTPKNF